MPVNNRIRKIRRDMEMTQDELAEKVGISQQYLSKLERNLIPNPAGEIMLRIAEEFNMPVESIFYRV